MKDRAKQAKALITALRELNTEGMVCDSVAECDFWVAYHVIIKDLIEKYGLYFRFCPGCGKSLNWKNWESLKCGGNL